MTRTEPLSQAIAGAPPGSLALVAHGALARILLGEAALGGGGVLLPMPGGGHALVGIAAGPAARACAVMESALGEAPRRIPLPEGAAALRAAPAPAPAPAPGPRLRPLLDAGGTPRAQLLSPGPGEAGAAMRALLRALVAGEVALRPGLRLFLECPGEAPPSALGTGTAGDDPRAPVAVLPLAALADPAALLAREGALRAAGWACGLLGDDPAALDWMGPGRWALAPAGPLPPASLPPQLVLLGPRPPWAPPWALHGGAA